MSDVPPVLENAVTRLRQRELAQSRRAFIARGGRMVRCPHCLLSVPLCLCSERPAPSDEAAVCLIFYKGEVYKPSNSGRLVADVLSDNHAFLWNRTEPDPALLALLTNPAYAPVLVFPFQYADSHRRLDTPAALQQYRTQAAESRRKPLLVLLDGSWREARKMFRSPGLANLPVLGIQPQAPGNYQLREAAHDYQLGTAEVTIEILQQLQAPVASARLAVYFNLFRERYLAGKPSH
ncbi:tRNA-uridine aminocarboxypropyltransferase [Oceanobacter sp. 4_MG-2023]|uniref:tRNA-uridine aminocarboxypropyltransferase n=1 Tax=Oceanobacter sp. 4_MG-2023 TaxID=3062623 RepID=UPI002732A499|nr:DTW domain-containing protein [Oceanobacter sp. 4_MG-2023]MDP2546905.1 DTW domain-containing protein [Oceanobacter sp. 4_MG-2023]